jgi:hypothetical protein
MKKPEPLKPKVNETKFSKFQYVLAWITCFASWGSAVVAAVKDKPPPNREQFT